MAENFKILKEKENLLFDRREIEASIEAEVTPSRIEARKLIAEQFSVSPESVKIKKIFGKFGSRVFLINANVYSSKEKKDAIEFKTKREKQVEAKLAEEENKRTEPEVKKEFSDDAEKTEQEETVKEQSKEEISEEGKSVEKPKQEQKVEEIKEEENKEPIKEEIKQGGETE